MNRAEKHQEVESLREALSEIEALFLADYRGLTVEEANELRREFRNTGCSYRVVKNTLLKRAVDGTSLEGLNPLLEGPTAVAFSAEEPLQPAKVLAKFAKEMAPLEIKGAFYEGVRTPEDVISLSKMPGKDELRSQLLQTMLAAPQNLMRLFNAASQRFLMVLSARGRELEE
jgi:large subunit ribosomal protein L10